MTLGRRGQFDRAADFSLKCIQKEKIHRGAPTIPSLVPFLTTIYLFQGRLHAAANLCGEFLNPVKKQGILISTAGNMDVILGDVLYEWNCLDEAEKHIREGLRANEPWGNIMTDAFGLLALIQVLIAKKDFAGAMETTGKLETRLQAPTRPVEFEEPYRTQRVRVQLAGADLQNAFQWADQIHLDEGFRLHRECYLPTLARIRLAQGRYADVEELLTEMAGRAGSGNQLVRELESGLLRAAAMAGQHRLTEAFGIIESCLALAEPEGYIRIFIEIGEPVRDLLAAYPRSDTPGHKLFARKVLEAFSSSAEAGVSERKTGGLIEPLTERELEVLALIAAGKTNREVARQLIVAPGTVKAHTAGIFRKLGVANRTEAAARARELGLLP